VHSLARQLWLREPGNISNRVAALTRSGPSRHWIEVSDPGCPACEDWPQTGDKAGLNRVEPVKKTIGIDLVDAFAATPQVWAPQR
jgi:hypothetical protein